LLRRAEKGDSASQLALANLYQSGEGVGKDATKATSWLREAASKGEPEAAYRLGNAYKMGQGVPASKVDAYCWYVLAAKTGHAASEQQIKELTTQLSDGDIAAVRYRLGQMHLRGVGTKADNVSAYFWFELAEIAGHPNARQAKQELRSQMNQEQIATASEKAAKWLQAHSPRPGKNNVGEVVLR
jgi:TPR repeat protein